jgi:lipopolysaccharide transport system permease protein
MAWYQFVPSWRILTLPVFVGLAILAALGPGLIITALMVRFRDFRFLVPFIVQFGLYASPVAYSSSVVRERLGERLFLLYSLNPMVAVIDAFRWALLESAMHWPSFLVSLLVAIVLCLFGLRFFRTAERSFADLI